MLESSAFKVQKVVGQYRTSLKDEIAGVLREVVESLDAIDDYRDKLRELCTENKFLKRTLANVEDSLSRSNAALADRDAQIEAIRTEELEQAQAENSHAADQLALACLTKEVQALCDEKKSLKADNEVLLSTFTRELAEARRQLREQRMHAQKAQNLEMGAT